jgi:hypothetical protein
METPIQTYRRRAAEYRKEAELQRDFGMREALLEVAKSYDRLADEAEGKRPYNSPSAPRA